MRTETIAIYSYDELPTDMAKEAAREWWRSCERQDPAWWNEHEKTCKAAHNWCMNLPSDLYGQALADWIKANESADLAGCCPWTGYCDDEVALDVIRAFVEDPSGDETAMELLSNVANALTDSWDNERESMEDDDAMVEENIRCNHYEFNEDGGIA